MDALDSKSITVVSNQWHRNSWVENYSNFTSTKWFLPRQQGSSKTKACLSKGSLDWEEISSLNSISSSPKKSTSRRKRELCSCLRNDFGRLKINYMISIKIIEGAPYSQDFIMLKVNHEGLLWEFNFSIAVSLKVYFRVEQPSEHSIEGFIIPSETPLSLLSAEAFRTSLTPLPYANHLNPIYPLYQLLSPQHPSLSPQATS